MTSPTIRRLLRQWFGAPKARKRRTRRIIGLEQLEERLAPAANMVLDLNIVPTSLGSDPGQSVDVNGTLFFVASDGVHGTELWKSDGTAAGTALVKDILVGSGTSFLDSLTNVNGTLFFTADNGFNGTELWKSDGTEAGTVLVKDLRAGTSGSFGYGASNLTNVNGTLFFAAYDGINGTELWKSDGTEAGTALVKDSFAGSGSSFPSLLTNVNGTLFFTAMDGVNSTELWKSDGTEAGTVLVKDIRPGSFSSSPVHLTNVNGTLFFTASDGVNGGELWKSDGTGVGTILVTDIRSGTESSFPSNLTNVNGTLFFAADDGVNGRELWKSDGTAAGTVLVKDVFPGADTYYSTPYSSQPDQLEGVNGTLFFTANDGVNGRELWKSDGTDAGTVLVKDIRSDFDSYPANLTNVNGTLFFTADNGLGKELWKSDGTSAGTVLVKDIFDAGSISSDAGMLTNLNGTLFFSATNGDDGKELWKSDGTAAGTVMVKDIRAGSAAGVGNDGSFSYPANLTDVDGTLFFTGNAGFDPELWKSDGTEAGTVLVKDIDPDFGGGLSVGGNLTNVNGTLFFAAREDTHGQELWKSDGTAAGTVMVKDIRPGTAAGIGLFNGTYYPNGSDFTNINGTLFFMANNGVNGMELWKSDGTEAGTVMIKDIRPGSSGSFGPYSGFTNVNGTLFFVADDGVNGWELWKSDGTEAGTVMVKDIAPGSDPYDGTPFSSYSRYLTNIDGTLFFAANQSQLWKSDGTEAGTVLVKNIGPVSLPQELTNVNGTLFFTADDDVGRELWKSDGTAAGTVMVKDIRAGGGSSLSYGADIINVNGTLFFAADDGINGKELWKSDGTDAGTVLVKDIWPGGSAAPGSLTNINGTLFFTANDGIHGIELWQSDGTEAGTFLTAEIVPGSGDGSPKDLLALGGSLFFTADNGVEGRELWVIADAVVVQEGGPLTLNTPTTGRVAAAGNVNEWTFFGRADQSITVEVNPSVPALDFAEVSVLDPGGNVLASGSATTAGQTVSILGVDLPADGTYRIRVGAPAAQPSSTGNYRILAADATVRTQALSTNHVTYGQLFSAFAVDRWTFHGSANQQVQFNFVATAHPSIRFDLTAPNGTPLFTNLGSSSGLITLPGTGTFVLTAHGHEGVYAFALDQFVQTTLTLGAAHAGSLVVSGQFQLFQVDLAEGNPLLIQLDDSTNTDRNEVYVRRGTPPTRGLFDFRSSQAGADQTVQVPFAAPGTWYVLVYAQSVPSTSNFTLLAQSSALFLNSVTPDSHAANAAVQMSLAGSGFLPGTQVTLEASGSTLATAQTVQVNTFSQLTASFDLSGVTTGTYDVRATLPGGTSALLPGAFTVLAAGQAQLETQLVLPSRFGRHAIATIYVEYANTGNAAMPAPILTLQSADADGSDKPLLTLDQTILTQGFWTSALPDGFSHSIQIYASGASAGVLLPGEKVRVPVYYAGLQTPWNFSDNKVELEIRIHQAGNTDTVDWAGMKDSLRPSSIAADAWDAIYPNLTVQVGSTWGDYVNMLSANAAYLGQQGLKVTNVKDLFGFALQQAIGLSPVSLLTSATDAAVPAPGLSLGFSRSFGNSIVERYEAGPFGQGWTAPWQVSLDEGADGRVTIAEHRSFQPDSRYVGAYFSQPGDAGILRKVSGGAWELTETSGEVMRFRADRTLEYIQDVNGNRITAGFTSGRLSSLTHSSGASLTVAYNAAGLIASITAFAGAADTTGRTTTYSYDATNTYLLSVTGPAGTTSYTYDTGTSAALKHALLTITDPSGVTKTFEYDSNGRLSATSLTGNLHRVTYGYNLGTVTATDATGVANKTFFDHRGLVVRAEDGLGNYLRYEFNDRRQVTRMTDSLGHAVSYTLDNSGRPKTVTDPLGNVTNFTLGGPNGDATAFKDANGNSTRYGYDVKGNLTATTYADNSVESAVYGALGTPTSLVNRRGQTVTFTYNAAGQVTQETFPDSSSNTYTYDVRGRLATAVDSHGTTSFTYDTADRLTRVDYPGGRFIQYTYDASGRRTFMEDNSGFKVHYLYDALGRLSELKDATGVETRIVLYTYDAAGRLQREDKGNATYTLYTYDGASRVTSIVNKAPDDSVNSRFDYTYDALGRRTAMATLDGTWTYSYDLTGQLTRAVFASTSAIPNQDLTYNYDALGNRTSTVINGTTTNYSANSLNEYTTVGATTNTYDADGNLIQEVGPGGTTTYSYDALNRLTQVVTPTGTWQYEYDAFGNRVAKVVDGVRTEYLLDAFGTVNVHATYDGSGTRTATYAHGFGLQGTIMAGSWNYYDFDALGSTAGVSDVSGAYTNRYVYEPFGATLVAQQGLANPFQFVGAAGVTAEGNGLNFMRARFYSTGLGRFESMDPSRLAGGDANFYRYAANNPVNVVDPSGLCGITVKIEKIEKQIVQWWESLSGGDKLVLGGAITAAIGIPLFLGITAGGPIALAAAIGETLEAGLITNSLATAAYGTALESAIGYGAISMLKHFHFPIDQIIKIVQDPCPEELPDPPGGTGDQGDSGTAGSVDPNDFIGPPGFGPQHFMDPAAGQTFPYTINFENASTATAPAQRVVITSTLNANLNWNTFEFSNLGFGDTNLSVDSHRQHYETTVPMTFNDQFFNVEIEANFNPGTGELRVTFQSVDPTTSLPPDVLTGFLPPEDGTGRGMGYLSFVIEPDSGLTTGTQIRNVALIQFDANEIIATNQVDEHDPSQGTDPNKEALVTIDVGNPTSSVTALPATSRPKFVVKWSGQDDAGGAGVASYDVYVSDNGAAATLWQTATTATQATFTGQEQHGYTFHSVARDNVGHVQAAPFATQTTTVNSTLVGPTSSVLPLATYNRPGFTVSWSTQDSSVTSFDVYVSDNGAAATLWQANTTATSAVFTGAQDHHTYAFYSLGRDNLGNLQTVVGTTQSTTVAFAADHLTITAPTQAFVGGDFSVTVNAVDVNGFTDPLYNGSVALSLNAGPIGGKLAGKTIANFQSGVATLDVLSFNVVGSSYQLLASSTSDLAAALSTPIGVVKPSTTRLRITGVPATRIAGQAYTVTVTALTPANLVDTRYLGTVQFTSTDPQVQLPDYTFTAADRGIHRFTVTFTTHGNQYLSVGDDNFIASRPINVVSAATRFRISDLPATILSGQPFTIRVTAVDALNQRVTDYQGTVRFQSTDPQAILPADYTFTAGDQGEKTFTVTLATTGLRSLIISDTSRPTLRVASTAVAVKPSTPGSLAAAITGPAEGVRGQPLTYTLTAGDGQDPNAVFTYRIDWDGNGVVDQTVAGPSGVTVGHAFPTARLNTIKVKAVDSAGSISSQAGTFSANTKAVDLTTDPSDSIKTALIVGGTAGNDVILISPADAAGQSVTVRINGVLQPGGPFSPTGHILVYGQTGNDVIKVASATIDGQTAKVAIPAILFGDAGNDTLSVAGSSANNVLVGGTGNDNTTGGGSRDMQVGGAGADILRAGAGDNALIGGSTIHDLDAAALLALAAEWSRTDIGYENRVQDLFGSGSGGLNGASRLDPQAVVQDTAIDQLFGGTSGMDWFWLSTSIKATTKLKNYAAGEVVTFE